MGRRRSRPPGETGSKNRMPKMKRLKKGTIEPLEVIISSLINGQKPDGYFSLYCDSEAQPKNTTNYLIAEPVTVDDDLNEHLPEDATAMGLDFAFSDETLETVISYARKREPTANSSRLVELLDYYSKHDTFP